MRRFSIVFLSACLFVSASCVKGSATRSDSTKQYRSGYCGKNVLKDLELLEQYCDIESSDKQCKNAAEEFLNTYPDINCSVQVTTTNEDTNDVEVSIEKITSAWVKQLAESLSSDDEEDDSAVEVEEESLREI